MSIHRAKKLSCLRSLDFRLKMCYTVIRESSVRLAGQSEKKRVDCMKKLLAFLLAALLISALVGCALLPSESTSSSEKRTAAPTTVLSSYDAKSDDLVPIRAILQGVLQKLKTASTSVSYDDPAVGSKLRASSTLTNDAGTYTYTAKVDRLNPADAERFTTEETVGPITGTLDKIRANYEGVFLWDRIATGLVLATPNLSAENLSDPVIMPGTRDSVLTATVAADQIAAVFGAEFAAAGIADLSLSVTYSETAVTSIALNYTVGDAAVSVTTSYGY